MARQTKISPDTVNRIWRAFGLRPHIVETFKLSPDPQFVEKVRDIVGLYLSPPERAVVLCVDEKSGIQALDRTQPLLPMQFGGPELRTHDYVRHGVTSLFAALDTRTGDVIHKISRRHRQQEFVSFMDLIEERVPPDLTVHVILDNLSTHKTPRVKRWMERHPRFVPHFIPTSSSWLNLVERWFGELTSKRIRRGSFVSVPDLKRAIDEFLDVWNEQPKPFVWTATVESICQKLARCRQTLQRIQPGCTLPRRRKAKKNMSS